MSLKSGDLVEVLVDGVWEKRIFVNSESDGSIFCVKKSSEEDYLKDKPFKTDKYTTWRPIDKYKCSLTGCISSSHNCDICLENPEVVDKINLLKNSNPDNISNSPEDSLDKFKDSEDTVNKIKSFLVYNKVNIRKEIIEDFIKLYEECKIRSNYIKKLQISFSIDESYIYLCLYKYNSDYIVFNFDNRGIKYFTGLFYLHNKPKLNNYNDILDILDSFVIFRNWITPFNNEMINISTISDIWENSYVQQLGIIDHCREVLTIYDEWKAIKPQLKRINSDGVESYDSLVTKTYEGLENEMMDLFIILDKWSENKEDLKVKRLNKFKEKSNDI